MDKQKTHAEFVSRDLPTPLQEEPRRRVWTQPSAPRERREAERVRPVRRSGPYSRQKKEPFRFTQKHKFAICLAVVALCLGLRLLPMTFAKEATQTLKNVFTYDLDLDETLGRLKFVENLFPGVQAVFGGQGGMSYPVEGTLVSEFDQQGKDVRMKASAGGKVKAAADGQVEKRATNETLGHYLCIRHPDNVKTVYYGLAYSPLAEGASVAKGQEIGTLEDSGVLVFQVLVNGVPRDPMPYLGAQ